MTKCTLNKVKTQIRNLEKIFTKDVNRWFLKNDFKIALKYMKRDSTLPIIREIKSKTTLRFDIILENFQKFKNKLCWQNCGEIVFSYTAGRNEK